ncbi:MAG: hypothetical protein ACI85O_003672 [Saprospiraceae bacterium]|jgi:hypothetical protein
MSAEDNSFKNTKRPDDISVRGLLLKAKEYSLLLLRRWWLVAVFAFLFGGQSFYSVRQIKPVYSGEIVLLVSTQNTAKENKNRVLTFSRFVNSPKLFEKIILDPIDTLGSDLLINRYLQTYFELNPKGLSRVIPANFIFLHNYQADFTKIEATVFKEIVKKISTVESGYADGFLSVSLEESLGLITFGIATPDADLTISIIDKINVHFQGLIFTYSSFAETAAYKNLKLESDSLEAKYRLTARKLTWARNRYQIFLELNGVTGETSRRAKEIEYLGIDAEIYKSKFLVTLKELKAAQSEMNMSKPIVEVIRQTLPPLEEYRPSPFKAAIKNGMIGTFLMIVLIILHKVFMDILEEARE